MTISNRAKMRLMDLPMEILLEIFKRLPVKSVCCLRCVSKTLLDMVDSPLFVSLHSSSLIATNAVAEAPQIMLRLVRSYCGTTQTNLLSLNYSRRKGELNFSEILSISDEHHYTVPFVFNNLFCFKNPYKDERCFLIDPFRGEVLQLPTSNILQTKYGTDIYTWQESYGMGFDILTSTFKIIRLSEVSYYTMDLVAQVLVLGTSTWHEIPVPASWGDLMARKVCAYGDVHWLGVNHIISFDFTKEEFHSTRHPVTVGLQCLNFITLRGSIAIVDTSPGTNIDIWVMKDYNKKEWTLEYNINLQMLKPNLQYKKWNAAHCGEWEDGIFFILGAKSFFFDLRHVPVNCVECPIEKKKNWGISEGISSLKRSLLSLKKFGNLIEETEPGSHSLLHFYKNYFMTAT